MRNLGILLALCFVSPAMGQVTAAVSGIPGDGIPDVFYHGNSGLLQLRTDGADLVALLVSDSDAHFLQGCLLCDEGVIRLPPTDHTFSVGNSNQSTQWVRTTPMTGTGPLGIFDIGYGPTGLGSQYFEEIFDDQAPEALWSFRFFSDAQGQFFSNVTSPTLNIVVSDFNYDGSVDIADLDLMTMAGDLEVGVAISVFNGRFDLVRDDVIDNQDVDEFLARAAFWNGLSSPYLRGDANLDGVVDGEDFIAWNASKFAADDRWSRGDFTGNGIVDEDDFELWNANSFMSSIAARPVPESHSGWLWMIGATGVIFSRPARVVSQKTRLSRGI